MEMDSIEVSDHTALVESVSPENSISTDEFGNSGIYGEPEILPRVGDQYQVEIPALIPVSDYTSLLDSLDKLEITGFKSSSALIAMSIPLTWITEEAKNKEDSLKSQCVNEAGLDIAADDSMRKVCPKSDVLENSVLQHSHGGKGHRLVPSWMNNNEWSELEDSGFLLGLYVFGKNLDLVKKLVGSKEMGDILPYYYGSFFGSDRFRRWSECRKMRNRKCVFGQRIFMGSRHQELLSRLIRDASEECQNAVMEMSKAFGEGKLVLEEYFFALVSKLGLRSLIDAMAIGKGKRDLTGNHNQVAQSRREIPTGKPLTALNPSEIMSILTGGFRLSKTKTSDLFWDSVWPRLLARGWHSEQPNSASNALVYLVPGITKFSRIELVKGDHYFDSVTDVLALVALRPELLEIEGSANEDDEDNGWIEEARSEHCYLKPRAPNRDIGDDDNDSVKFTVVDTSRYANGRARKLRELRSLPAKALDSTIRSEEEGDDRDSSEAFETQTDGVKLALLALPAYNNALRADKKRMNPNPKPSLLEEGIENGERFGPRIMKHRKRSRRETSSDLIADVVVSYQAEKPSLSPSSASTSSSSVIVPSRTVAGLDEPASRTVVENDNVVFAPPRDEKTTEPEPPAATWPESEAGPLPRRQSTRSRPPTAKALEAFAYGFMEAKQKRKAKEAFSSENPRPRNASSRRARVKLDDTAPPESFEPVTGVDFPMEEAKSSVHNANGDVFNNKLTV